MGQQLIVYAGKGHAVQVLLIAHLYATQLKTHHRRVITHGQFHITLTILVSPANAVERIILMPGHVTFLLQTRQSVGQLRRSRLFQLFQQPCLPGVPLLLMPEVPGSLIRLYLLRSLHTIIGSPGTGRRHHVVVIAKREPALLPLINQSRKIHPIIISRSSNFFIFTFFHFYIIKVVWPSAGSPFQRVGMIAKSRMHRRIAGDTLIQSSCHQCQESPLTRSCHTSLLSVPGCVLLDIVHRTDTAHNHMVIVVFFAVVHIKLPVPLQGAIAQVIVHPLLHRHRNAVDTNLQGYHTLRGRIYIATIGTHTSTGHTQQGRIFPFAHGHAQYTIGTRAPAFVVKAYFIYVYILRTTLRQQTFGRVQVGFSCFGNALLPELLKILWHHGRWLQFLRTKRSAACPAVILAIHMGSHIQSVESRFRHRTLQFQTTVFQGHAFANVLIHLRSHRIIYSNVFK